MSKIQFNELNASELEVLNAEKTSEVVGGFFVSVFKSTNFSNKSVELGQFSYNDNAQAAIGGGLYSSNGNSNGTGQGNNAVISQ